MMSRGTRRTGTSRNTKFEEDFENMEVEEVDALIDAADMEMKAANKSIRGIKSNPANTFGNKEQKMKPFEETLKYLRSRMHMLYLIRGTKIPFWEKLPKDN